MSQFVINERLALLDKIANVMQTNTVIKNVFSYLSLRDIKNCRYVCQNWKSITEPLLRKRSKIVLDFSAGRTPSSFLETYGFLTYGNMKFTSFSFSRGYWPKSLVRYFLVEQRRNIHELEFNNITLTDENNDQIENPCISDWISDLPMLKKLSVLCSQPRQPMYRNWDCNLVVSLEVMQSVQELILDSCKVNVKGGAKISPKSIKFNFVTFHHEGNIMEEFQINDLIDFKKASIVDIKCPIISSTCRGTKLKLNLEDCTQLSELKLTQATVENWGGDKDKCNLQSLYLDGVPYFGNKDMKVKKLSFQCSVINLTAISTQIEEIYLYSYANSATRIFCAQPLAFPDLKRLYLFGETAQALASFRKCPNLQDLYIGGHHDQVLNLKLVADSVKRIHIGLIKNIVSVGAENERLEIDLLVLDSYTFEEAVKVMTKIKPKTLVMDRKILPDEFNDSVMTFVDKLYDVKTIYVGPLPDDTKNRFTWKRFSSFVDKKSSFYVFENQRGKAISKEILDSRKIPTSI